MFGSLVELVTASGWVYPLILGIAALDAVFPLVPSETTVVAAAALAGTGDLALSLVLLTAAGGAVIGDNVAYVIGLAGKARVSGRSFGTPKWRARLAHGETMLQERTATIIVVSRFIPGGRTATMLSAGLVALPWLRFAAYDLAAGVLWAGYSSSIGFAGGKAFADEPLHALLLAFGVAVALTLLIETGRRVVARRSARRSSW